MLKISGKLTQDKSLEEAVNSFLENKSEYDNLSKKVKVGKSILVEYANGEDVEITTDKGTVVVKQTVKPEITNIEKIKECLTKREREVHLTQRTEVSDKKSFLKLAEVKTKLKQFIEEKITPKVSVKK